MDCLTKLEPKIENDEGDSTTTSTESNNVFIVENQPSSSASLNNSTVTSSATTQLNSFDSDSESDDCTEDMIVKPRRTEKILEVVDIVTSEEEEDEIIQTPRKAGLRQLQNRRCFKENSDSDSDEVATKRTKFSDPDKTYNVLDEPIKLLRKLKKSQFEADVILEKYIRCTIDGGALRRRKLYDLEMEALREILENHGKIIERLSLNRFYWEETKSMSDFSPFNIYALLTKLCKNLQVLKFSGSFGSIKLMKLPCRVPLLPNLREIHYTCGRMETAAGNNRDVVLRGIYAQIFKGATSLERLEYTFLHLNEADQVLKAMKDATEENPWKSFKRLQLKSSDDDVVLKEEQIATLGAINAPTLEHLELGNGLWEDVQAKTFEKMLAKFPKLQTLIIHGSRQGDPSSAKSDCCIHFPRLDKLTHLSIGAEYEFESIIQTSTSNVVAVSDSSLEFLKFQIHLPHMPNLRSIILGNLINIDDLTFKNFPNLEIFKVGGPWNQTCNFLAELPHAKITDLQFPDALKDSSLSARIPLIFPKLKRLWIFLPSVFCLRGFFEAMGSSNHVRVEELHIKTQFDFESTLESCLLGRSTASLRSKNDVKNLKLLERYSHFEDYVRYYNIELPIKDEPSEDISSPGIGVLKSLKVLQMEHIPRILRIPAGKHHWLDYRCILTNDFIGYRRYPLSQKCINELHIKNLHTFVWPNFEFQGSIQKFVRNGLEDIAAGTPQERTVSITNNSRRNLRVTIQPSMLRTKALKIKNERS